MATAKALSIGGVGAQPNVDEVLNVAQGLIRVELDPAGADRIKKESPSPKAFSKEPDGGDAEPREESAFLTKDQARAVIAVKLMNIMNGKSGARLQLAEFLKELLNRDVIPALPAGDAAEEAAVLRALADACKGQGTALADNRQTPLAEALLAAELEPPGISAGERAVLESGSSAAAGIGALVIAGSRRLMAAATAVAALSCDAYGAQIKALDPDVVEAQGHKAAIAAADELRGLLEGSKLVNTRKASQGSPQDAALFSGLPQALGAAAEEVAGAYGAVRPEVQGGALAPGKDGGVGSSHPLVAVRLAGAARALLVLAKGSLARARAVAGAAPPASGLSGGLGEVAGGAEGGEVAAAAARERAVGLALLEDPEAAPGVAAALAAAAALGAAHGALAVEALAAAAALRLAEGPALVAVAGADGGGAAAPGAPAGGAAPSAAGGKDKGRKDKKGGAAFVLGKGSAIVRAFVEGAAAAGGGSDGDAAALPLGDGGAALAAEVVLSEAAARVAAALAPLGSGVGKLLEEVRGVVEANQARRKPKVPKGARDFLPDQMSIREAAFNTITAVFKRHGAVSIDTPVFELRETLMGKYGEDSKLIYDLADQGGELLSLRYDLTVPFARYVAVHQIGNIKRYHIGKVYRRDQPQMNRGRFREFFQCDFDIAGSYATMVPDAEVLKVVIEILSALKLGSFEVKLNHRLLLDAMLAIAGVPPQKFRAICSAIDKLDKEPWAAVRHEMVVDKGLPQAVADTIGQFVVLRGEPRALLAQLSAPGHPLAEHPGSAAALSELRLLFDYLAAMDALDRVVFDLSLARGLDYYTGVIYEAVLAGSNVGSIAAGGRYDKLVGMFSGKDVPAVGVSIGIERVFAIMEAQARERAAAPGGSPIRATETEVLVASIGNGMQAQRMQLCNKLWAAGIKAEFGFKPNPKMGDQLGYALEQGIPFMVLFGEDELKQGVVKVKDMGAKAEDVVRTDELVAELQRRIAAVGGAPSGSNTSGATEEAALAATDSSS